MSAPLFVSPWFRPLDSSGAIMPGAKLIFFASETTTPVDVYSDGNLGTALGNEVEADASGRFTPFYLDPRVLYRVQLKDSTDVLQPDGDVDPLIPAAGSFIGEVKMFDGSLEDIPAGWVVCDGTGGTIDTRDRHPRGVGSETDFGETGGSSSLSGNTGSSGAHDHGGTTGGHALTADENGPHGHAVFAWNADDQDASADGFGRVGSVAVVGHFGPANNEYITTNTNGTPDELIEESGQGDAHAHSIASAGAHTHTISGTIVAPFFGIHFIKFVGA